MTEGSRDRFRGAIARSLGVPADAVTLFAKGRVALYAILRALDVGPGDEVIVPAFTCVAVPNAILYTGARPVWVDVDPRTLTIDPAAAEAAITPRTRVILAQNTFGLSADLGAIAGAVRSRGIAVVDDCTHGLGGRYRDRPNGSTARLSFFSTQWSKPVSTGLGGFAVALDAPVAARLRELEAEAGEPGRLRAATLRVLVLGRERAGNGRLLRSGRASYRALGRLGVVPGSSSQEELVGNTMPEGFLAGLSASQAALGSRGIERLPHDVARRQAIASRYSAWLAAHDRTPAAEPEASAHAFLRYPLRVAERTSFVAAAGRKGIDLGDWFRSPVHPVTERLERWDYQEGSAPCAEAACREIVNLPTHPGLADRDVDRVLELLAEQVQRIA